MFQCEFQHERAAESACKHTHTRNEYLPCAVCAWYPAVCVWTVPLIDLALITHIRQRGNTIFTLALKIASLKLLRDMTEQRSAVISFTTQH